MTMQVVMYVMSQNKDGDGQKLSIYSILNRWKMIHGNTR